MSGHESANPMVTDVFVKGAVQGWNIAVTSTIPNVLMAFVIIKVLNHSGLLTIFGELFAPIMAIFGLPGEAAAVLLGGWMSMGGGVGVAVSLFDQGFSPASTSPSSPRRSTSWAARSSTWAAASA